MRTDRGHQQDDTSKRIRARQAAMACAIAAVLTMASDLAGAFAGSPRAMSPATSASTPAAGAGPAAAPAGALPGWQEETQRQIAASEYHVTWQAQTPFARVNAAWQAPNRSHGFRTYFTPQGIRLVPRGPQAADWEWSLTLAGYGRGESVWQIVTGNLSPTDNRIEYRRGGIDEWYVNSPRGLEHGFLLPAPPEQVASWSDATPLTGHSPAPGRGRDIDPEHLIHLDLDLGGGLMPVVSTDGQAIDFTIPGGASVVHYAELAVTGADGTVLPAWMEGYAGAGKRGIRLVVDARTAVYPITIDPLATSPAWTAESNQVSAFLGISVSTAGDVNGDGYGDVKAVASR